MLISHIDHVTLVVADLPQAIAAYSTLLGRPPLWRGSHPEVGTVSALFGLGNATLELLAPGTDDERTAGMHAWLAEFGNGLQTLAFGADDLDALRPTLRERGIPTTTVDEGEARGDDGSVRGYRSVSLSPVATRGVNVMVVERGDGEALRTISDPQPAHVEALDHIVLRSAVPDAAVALYQDRLGLRLALDRKLGDLRMLFFRVGGVTLEVVEHREPAEGDALWGLAFRVRDIEAAHGRLVGAGVELSAIRDGHKAGTRTFTVSDGVCGVPTLVIRDPSRD